MSKVTTILAQDKVYRKVEAPTTETTLIRIAGKTYVLAQMTAEQAEKAAFDISQDISALALFLKAKGLSKDYDNAMGVSKSFSNMADKLGKLPAA